MACFSLSAYSPLIAYLLFRLYNQGYASRIIKSIKYGRLERFFRIDPGLFGGGDAFHQPPVVAHQIKPFVSRQIGARELALDRRFFCQAFLEPRLCVTRGPTLRFE